MTLQEGLLYLVTGCEAAEPADVDVGVVVAVDDVVGVVEVEESAAKAMVGAKAVIEVIVIVRIILFKKSAFRDLG